MSRWHLGTAALAGLLLAAAPADDAKKDAQALQGTWKVVRIEQDGKKRPEDEVKGWRLIVKGDRMTAKDGDETLQAATFRLDPSQKPRALDLACTEGADEGKTMHAVYEINGDDLKICVDPGGRKRPGEFAAPEGSEQILIVYKREKP
jgi:uncharacterized protein (TIGR03067 family)